MKKQAIDDSNVLCAIKRQRKKQAINDLNVLCGTVKVTNEQRAIDDLNVPPNGETGHI